jgi:ketosteroid isomerase-like protein
MLHRPLRPVSYMALVLAAGCAAESSSPATPGELLAVDQEWAEVIAGGDVDAILEYWHDQALIIPANQSAIRGKEAIREFVNTNRAMPAFSMKIEPKDAMIAESGEFGHTLGTYEMSAHDSQGNLVTVQGRYLSAWRRGADGAWKCILEIHSPLGPGSTEPDDPHAQS